MAPTEQATLLTLVRTDHKVDILLLVLCVKPVDTNNSINLDF